MKKKVSDLVENTKQHAVSFSARAYENKDIQPWETLLFPDVEHNYGGAYNHTSGTFFAPVSGTYIFYCNILTKEDSYIEMAMLVNTQIKLLIYSAGKNNLGSGSNLLVIDLEEGDAVEVVKYGPWGSRPFYVHAAASTFSGFLLLKAWRNRIHFINVSLFITRAIVMALWRLGFLYTKTLQTMSRVYSKRKDSRFFPLKVNSFFRRAVQCWQNRRMYNRKEGNDQKSIQLPNTFRLRHQRERRHT